MIDRNKLDTLFIRERELFRQLHPKSGACFVESSRHLLGGVPMPWMKRWAGSFPIFAASASGARITDVDGIDYIDFALGDTGAMSGHSLPQIASAIYAQANSAVTTMLPSEDAAWVAEALSERFTLPKWLFAMTATDANRFALRLARHLTQRPKIVVFDWCYHGSVDETLVTVGPNGDVLPRPGNTGPPCDPAITTKVVQFNDLDGLERALADGDVAAVLTEPALTNIGIVLPEEGFHREVRRLTEKYGTLLIIDETHTICAGPGGYSTYAGLTYDMLTIGKPIGGGVPAAALGMTEDLASRLESFLEDTGVDVSGIGGTLTANALSVAAMRVALATTLLPSDFAISIPLATQWANGVRAAIDDAGLPWSVQQLGARAEYWFCPPPRNGAEAHGAIDESLEEFFHLYTMNRGVLLTPFHNMALLSHHHSSADVDVHSALFAEALEELH